MGAVESAYTTPSTCPTCGGLKLPPKTATRWAPAAGAWGSPPATAAPLLSTLHSQLAGAGAAHVILRGEHAARAVDLDADALGPVVEERRAPGGGSDGPRRHEDARADA